MSIVALIVIALAIAVCNMLLFRRCAEPFPVRLSHGIGITFIVSGIQAALYILGFIIGDLLRIESPSNPELFNQANAYIMLGLFVIVIIKQLMPFLRREPKLPIFDITNTKAVMAMSVASGINIFILGIGVGFTTQFISHLHWALWPMLLLSIILSYLGIMFGRQKVVMRQRRWMVAASIILLGTAIATLVNLS